MFDDFFFGGFGGPEDVVSQVKHPHTIMDGNHWRGIMDDAVVEALQLGLDGVKRMYFGLFKGDLSRGAIGQVERQ